MNELELSALKQSGMKTIKTFSSMLVESVSKKDDIIILKLFNKLMKNVLINAKFGAIISGASEVSLLLERVEDEIKYSFCIDGEIIEVELGFIEETLVLREVVFKK